MISRDIKNIIDAVQAEKNSLERNKLNSHLQDALAWAEKLENKFVNGPHIADQCTCVVGAIDKNCPLHGSNK
jgi:hypothetical protein